MPSSTGKIGSASVTFRNYGPVTTTFSPAPSCTESNRYLIGLERRGSIEPQWRVQCSTTGHSGCIPPITTSTATDEDLIVTVGYHSPGLYCPSGWATSGLVSRDKGEAISYSGSAVPTTTMDSKSPDPYDYDYQAYLLAKALEPEETMVGSCPSSMTVDGKGGCQSLVPDYTPTFGCAPQIIWSFSTETSTRFTTVDGTTSKHITKDNVISTITTESTTTFDYSAKATYSAIEYFPVVTLVHRQADIDAAATSTSNGVSRMVPSPISAKVFDLSTFLIYFTVALILGAVIPLLQ
ncbi:hypothetical protein PENSTE_c009G04475 [Penicillium steckii]|uniref:Uncharacterized protein n=1 Tax=Penicillium steckii TaxID=303698 RepID=A0A1V6TBP7_9EURO|nr:hypothetical protein PENSTE_c009G04475 [Penicillium steckii]